MNLFPIDLIMEADVCNQNSSSIMAEGVLFLKNNFEEYDNMPGTKNKNYY